MVVDPFNYYYTFICFINNIRSDTNWAFYLHSLLKLFLPNEF